MVYCAEVAIEMPDSFPCDGLTRMRSLARDLLAPHKPPAWVEFAGASNLIAWRYRSYVDSATTALATPERTHEDIYRQERVLFVAVCSAVSCIDALGYATNALASDPQVLGVPFGVKEQRECTPRIVEAMLSAKSADPAVVEPWAALNAAAEWSLLRDLRVRMFHRSNLPRIVTGVIGGPPPLPTPTQFVSTSTTRAVRIDEVTELEPWLATTVASLLSGAIAMLGGTVTLST